MGGFRVCSLLQLNILILVLGINAGLKLITKLFFVARVIANYVNVLLKKYVC